MFSTGEIWAYPTDTSYGLGVRADDEVTLQRLADLKGRGSEKFFSLMVRDFEMLQEFAEVPKFPPLLNHLPQGERKPLDEKFFTEKPMTVLLEPTSKLPTSKFWPEKVAFRISTVPEVAEAIEFPITATSANVSGNPSLFDPEKIREVFGEAVQVLDVGVLPEKAPSEMWDMTGNEPVRLR